MVYYLIYYSLDFFKPSLIDDKYFKESMSLKISMKAIKLKLFKPWMNVELKRVNRTINPKTIKAILPMNKPNLYPFNNIIMTIQ